MSWSGCCLGLGRPAGTAWASSGEHSSQSPRPEWRPVALSDRGTISSRSAQAAFRYRRLMQQTDQSSSMDVETAIRAFASAGHDLPREAMRWALDHWDEAAPGLLGMLERFAGGADRSEEAAGAVFFILHLAGERRETRAFAPLCRLAKDAEAIDAVLGDGVTTTLSRIMISTYDGDLDTLKGVIEADGADEYTRAGALEVLAYLAATGRVAREEAEAYLLHLYEALRPQHESFVVRP